MAYWQWGDANAAHTVVCVHGLTRQGRDFDVLAQALVERAGGALRVVCPDVVGRGKSDWLKDPMGYQIPNYAADLLALLTALKPTTLDWVGTSMGGLIGMVVCNLAASVGVPVRRLVLNDVGPVIEWSALQRIGQYLGKGGGRFPRCSRPLTPCGPFPAALVRTRPHSGWRLANLCCARWARPSKV